MTNEIGSNMCPLNCPCQGDHGSDLGPLLVVAIILIAAHFARKWWKGKTSMRNVAIVLTLAAAIGVVVAIKQNKATAQVEAPAPAVASTQPLPRLVDLGARKCIPCKMMAPILEELKTTYAGQLDVEFIDVYENPMAGRQYGIEGIPTQIFISADGKELFRHWGFFSKDDILAKWKEFGVELARVADAAQ